MAEDEGKGGFPTQKSTEQCKPRISPNLERFFFKKKTLLYHNGACSPPKHPVSFTEIQYKSFLKGNSWCVSFLIFTPCPSLGGWECVHERPPSPGGGGGDFG